MPGVFLKDLLNIKMNKPGSEKDIVVFDGFCNFCSGSVLFIIRRDPGMHFRFVASQSPAGRHLVKKLGIGELASHSILLVSNHKIYHKSGAALRIARRLRGLWPIFYGCIVLPRAFRDFFYDVIARNRYRFYGMRDQCFIPDKSIRDRFL